MQKCEKIVFFKTEKQHNNGGENVKKCKAEKLYNEMKAYHTNVRHLFSLHYWKFSRENKIKNTEIYTQITLTKHFLWKC